MRYPDEVNPSNDIIQAILLFRRNKILRHTRDIIQFHSQKHIYFLAVFLGRFSHFADIGFHILVLERKLIREWQGTMGRESYCRKAQGDDMINMVINAALPITKQRMRVIFDSPSFVVSSFG
jgi:hypothetical protein